MKIEFLRYDEETRLPESDGYTRKKEGIKFMRQSVKIYT